MGRVYFFPSSAVIYNDKVLPIILELARQGNRVHTVFLDYQAYKALGEHGPYYAWLRDLTTMRPLVTKDRWRFSDKVVFVMRYAWLLLQMRWYKGYLAFFDGKGATKLSKALSRAAYKRGTPIIYTSSYVDAWQGHDWEAVLQTERFCQVLKGKSFAEYQKGRERVFATCDCKRVLRYTSRLSDVERHLDRFPVCVVPHPKLQRWWREFLHGHPPQFGHPVLDGGEAYVAVFLTHKGNYMFRDDSDLDVLLNEIIACVRQAFPDVAIMVKPKQTALYQQQWFENYRKSIRDERVYFVDAPVSLLAERALAGIMTGHSTAQFEFMMGKAPWIEYCRYSDFWKEVCSQLSYTLSFGGHWAQTPDELTALLHRVKDGQLKTDLNAHKERVQFSERDISFEFFTS